MVGHVPYQLANVAEFQKMNATFDVIYCKSVLEHMHDPRDFFLQLSLRTQISKNTSGEILDIYQEKLHLAYK